MFNGDGEKSCLVSTKTGPELLIYHGLCDVIESLFLILVGETFFCCQFL